MNLSLRSQILYNLEQRETDDLVRMWTKNDRVEWSEITFDVLAEILKGRLGELPSQDEPITEQVDPDQEELGKFEKLEKLENELLDLEVEEEEGFELMENEENAPVFYKSRDVFKLLRWLKSAAIMVVVVVSSIALVDDFRYTHLYFSDLLKSGFLGYTIAVGYSILKVALDLLLYYFPLKVLSIILTILMEMEFNSRGAVKRMSKGEDIEKKKAEIFRRKLFG